MTNTAQQYEWQWLRPYRAIARWVGWVLVALAIINFMVTPFQFIYDSEYHQPYGFFVSSYLYQSLHVLRNILIPGVLSLGVAQFLQWVSDTSNTPGWLLRKGPVLLAIGAIVYLLQFGQMLYRIPSTVVMLAESNMSLSVAVASIIIPNLLIQIAPVIILVGLAQALRRLSPIVDESKFLV